MGEAKKLPRIGIYGLTGCAGELLVVLENIAQVLPLAQVVAFSFAQSDNDHEGPLDIAFIEGTVSQKHDLEVLEKVRARSRYLVAIGNCAVWGNVQKHGATREPAHSMVQEVYGVDSPIEAMPSEPIDKHVAVDVKLSGCPINAQQLVPVVASLLKDHLPYITHKPVCLECKIRGNPCVLVEQDLPCLGPVTAAGCGSLCPSMGAACYGCWGPSDNPQMEAMVTILQEKGYEFDEVMGRLQAYGAPPELFSRCKPLDA